MEKKVSKLELIKFLDIIIKHTLKEETEINAIIVVGSNFETENLGEHYCIAEESDLDIIILTKSKSYLLNKVFNGIRFDISFVNQNDIVNILLSALNKSPFYGKLFSSLQLNSIIYDRNGDGHVFVKTIKYLYSIYTKSCLPNYSQLSIFLHNIDANLRDLSKNGAIDLLHAQHRLSIHLFDYIAHLIYPFHTSGVYRARVFGENLPWFEKKIILDENGSPVLNVKFLKKVMEETCPISKQQFEGVIYDSKIEENIMKGHITEYYFGYDNLDSESTLVFMCHKDIYRYSSKLSNVTNFVPFATAKQNEQFSELLCYMSGAHFNSNLEKRIAVLKHVTKIFEENNLIKTIHISLKAAMIKKSILELLNNNLKISLKDFHDWALGINPVDHDNQSRYNPMDEMISQNISYVLTESNPKEKEVKAGHLFFGVMKALRLKIHDLYFINSN